ncbi:MAG: hypothetical protein U0T56_02300 [Ferruginibacter sp.]
MATLVLTISAVSTSTVNQSICPSQLPYTWNSQYSAITAPALTPSRSRALPVATLLLHSISLVLPTTTSTTNIGLCPSQLPYSWNSQTINAAGTYTATLTGSNGCDSVATLVLTISAVSTSTVNQSICPSQLPYTWNSQTYNSAGTYSVTLTGSTGCDSVVHSTCLCYQLAPVQQIKAFVRHNCLTHGTDKPIMEQALIRLH